MNLNVNLAVEVEVALKKQAAAAGVDLAAYLARILTEQVADDLPSKKGVSVEALMQKLDEIAARHPPSDGNVDYSREAIYEGRGE